MLTPVAARGRAEEEGEQPDAESEEDEEEPAEAAARRHAAAGRYAACLDQPLHVSSAPGLTLRYLAVRLLDIVSTHDMPVAGIEALLGLIQELLPEGHNCPSSLYIMRKVLGCAQQLRGRCVLRAACARAHVCASTPAVQGQATPHARMPCAAAARTSSPFKCPRARCRRRWTQTVC